MGMEIKRRKRDSGWSDIKGGMAFVIPVLLLKHENFTRLSPYACKLLLDLGRQYTGANNGYLHPGINVMKQMGWRSAHTLASAIKELLHYRIIVQTVQGGRNRPSYYGFTFRSIKERDDRPFDRPLPILQPSNDWDSAIEPFENKSLVHHVHKASAPRAQVSDELMHDVHKESRTSAPRAQVRPHFEGELMHDVHSYTSMPYPGEKDAVPAKIAHASDPASDLSSKGSESNRRQSKSANGQQQHKPKAA